MRAHIMAPLSAATGKNNSGRGKIAPTPQLVQAFETVKRSIAEKVLLTYPDPNKPFDVLTDASQLQLGAVIAQEGKVIAFYSRKLTPAQLKYPTVDKEMLCIIETLNKYCEILWGARIYVHTDHMNLTRQNISSPRIMTWRMVCKEFMPVFKFIKGNPDNIVADTLSRLPFLEKEKGYPPTIATSDGNTALLCEDLFINYPANLMNFPLESENIRQHQQQQPDIVSNNSYNDMVFYGTALKVFTCRGKTKIVLPTALINNAMNWYHHVLGHAGQERLYKSISQHMYCPGLQQRVSNYIRHCPSCQRYKNSGRGIGHLAPTMSSLGLPWEEVAIDSIGPWKIVLPPPHNTVTINAFTIIDTTTNILGIGRATQRNATGEEACDALDNMWLTRYPKPVQCIFDQGKTFLHADFGGHLVNLGIKPVSTSVVNPQANAILERSHDVIKTAMRNESHENPPLTL